MKGRAARLISRLNHPHWLIRSEAAAKLGRLGGIRARKALLRALFRDRHVVVRRDCALALSGYTDRQVHCLLHKALSLEHDKRVRIGLWFALYQLGEPDRLIEVLSLFEDPDLLVQRNAVNVIETDLLRPPDASRVRSAIEALLSREADPGVRGDAEDLLRRLEQGQP